GEPERRIFVFAGAQQGARGQGKQPEQFAQLVTGRRRIQVSDHARLDAAFVDQLERAARLGATRVVVQAGVVHSGLRKTKKPACAGFLRTCRRGLAVPIWWAVQGSNLRPLPCEGKSPSLPEQVLAFKINRLVGGDGSLWVAIRH